MTKIEVIKNRLIDRVLATNNESLLKAIDSIFESTSEEEKVLLSSEQIEMLQMSENDIKNGDIVSESEIEKLDEEWLS
ncbi:hypothetical protein [Carboxylicivirga sp. N1Y90]|uniref:hypothetical protein n=1 Tax=Carboxylicivirga fragile TaxID=3417571 RepID=UPI003D34C20B|nr:hypothetical protein [Marinilabiliaceae bacterium N1Y90]